MDLLFLNAGYFVPDSFERKGPARFFRDRAIRQLHRRSGVVGCGARPAGLSGRADAGDEQTKAAGDQGIPGLAEGLFRGQGGGAHPQDQAAELL